VPGAAPVAWHVSHATAVRTFIEVDVDDDLEVLPARRTGAPAAERVAAAGATEERVEDVADVAESAAERIRSGASRRPLLAEHVVSATPFGVGQRLVGARDLLELGFRLGIVWVRVRVELTCSLPVGALEIVLACVPLDAEQLVVIHALSLSQTMTETFAHDRHRGQSLRVVHACRAQHADRARFLALDVVGGHDQ